MDNQNNEQTPLQVPENLQPEESSVESVQSAEDEVRSVDAPQTTENVTVPSDASDEVKARIAAALAYSDDDTEDDVEQEIALNWQSSDKPQAAPVAPATPATSTSEEHVMPFIPVPSMTETPVNTQNQNTKTQPKSKKKAGKDEKNNRSVRRALKFIWWIAGIIIFLYVAVFAAIAWGWMGKLPAIEDLQNPINKSASIIYSADGKVMGTYSYASANRINVPFDSLPTNLVKALVATEDERFYEHSGIDGRALGRAVVKRGVMRQKSAGGGSTITQQLAKMLYSDVNAHTTVMERLMQKPVEWYIAVQLERTYTKEEIIAMYFNYFDFLNNAVGIKSAAKVYFEKLPIDLSLEECATLVGMCKNPSYFNPLRFGERCKERRNLVLQKMESEGYITKSQMETAQAQPLDVSRFHPIDHKEGMAPYFRERLRKVMMAKKPVRSDYASNGQTKLTAWQYQQFYDDSLAWENDPLFGWCYKHHKKNGDPYNIYTDGLRIYTTIDSRMQQYAEAAAYKHVAETLQPRFEAENRGNKNAPYRGVKEDRIELRLWKAFKQSDRYRMMKKAGASEAEIKAAYETKYPMTLFSYQGNFETEMTPRDSILYYKKFLRTAVCVMEPNTGEIRAYVPGLDFQHFQYDNILGGGRRQVGSTIKPFLYSLAMMNGYTPCDEAPNDVGRRYGNWCPRSTHARAGQMVPLKWGLAQSSNTISAWVLYQMGPENMIKIMRQMGITTQSIEASMPLCLGPCDISVGEMVSAYSTFPNYGYRMPPVLVTRIEDSEGNVLHDFIFSTKKGETYEPTEIMDKEEAWKMLVMMRGVINEGTGRRLRGSYGLHNDMAGKTGTTNSNADGWFMGIVPKMVVGCWVGGEDRDIHFLSGAQGQGAAAALPIYAHFLKSVYADKSLAADYGITSSDKFDIPSDFDICEGELSGLERMKTSGGNENPDRIYEGELDELMQ